MKELFEEAARSSPPRRGSHSRLRRGRERLASLRRGKQPSARLLLPSLPSLGRTAHRGGLWAYQWIAQLSFARDSWVAPMDLRRVHPSENTNEIAAERVKGVLRRLPERGGGPLFVFDAGYDPVRLQQELEGERAQILVRLRAGRCFYADPPPPPPGKNGRPKRHGRKPDTKAPETWPTPSAEHRLEDPGYGTVRVRAWAKLQPKTQDHPTRGSRRPRPIVRGTLVLVEVGRLPRSERRREPKELCGCGGTAPESRSSTCSGAGVREALGSGAHLALPQTELGVDHPSG